MKAQLDLAHDLIDARSKRLSKSTRSAARAAYDTVRDVLNDRDDFTDVEEFIRAYVR